MMTPRDRLTMFLYLLIRDEVPAGVVEKIVQEVQQVIGDAVYSNVDLAKYAAALSSRLVALS